MATKYTVRKTCDGTFDVRGPGLTGWAIGSKGLSAKFVAPEHASLASALCEAAFRAGHELALFQRTRANEAVASHAAGEELPQ